MASGGDYMLLPRFSASRWIVVLLLSGATVLAACGGGEKVVEVTRVVEKPVAQTVVVEKPVAIEKVVQQTVVV
ncbi:MAG: ATP-dependent acyl-CoA ligase, partial [SAR202 cluster bacterium]|nr:ATP-dependent acyl-CoA ligase [SAR202 cluster bacterium]